MYTMSRQILILAILLALLVDFKFVVKPALAQVREAQAAQTMLYGQVETGIPTAPQRQALNGGVTRVCLQPNAGLTPLTAERARTASPMFQLDADHGQCVWGVLGARFDIRTGRIIQIYNGALCIDAGLREGDRIILHEGRDFDGWQERARDRGTPGTIINLTVSRDGN